MNVSRCCAICGITTKCIKHHLLKEHNTSLKEYYDNYIKQDDSEGFCKLCGKPTQFNGLSGYRMYCSLKCSNNDQSVKEKKTSTYLEKYGVANPSQASEVREKVKNTNIKKYGAPCSFQADSVKENIKKTMIERYGVDNPQKCWEIRERTKQTSIERYGGIGLGSEKIKSKAQKTCIEKYGVTNPFATNQIKEQLVEYYLEKFGVPYSCMTDVCRNAAVFSNSSCNLEFMKLLDENNIKYTREFPIDKKSYDFKVDNTLIEVNPTSTHNSTWGWRGHKDGIDKEYHKNSWAAARPHGCR